ncbi:hypothetical protein LF65_00747 [Clostridium beijerinckii]|uniref:Uncharacterized protein n=1 Tax=Clostridium beijerinckii TaxID=1520 RepID=A0A0B5Q5B0_CLOBE|nr:hypothetical protein [Clostridium beijerinckii]AJG97374.1 hypothetical protein LF65_00747 [Clostridium beijerinckii]
MKNTGHFLNSNNFIVDLTEFTTKHTNLLGGTWDKWTDHWKDEIDKVGSNVGGFFEKLGEDIEHLPEDAKKAVNDFKAELGRFNMEFNPLMKDVVDNIKDILDSIPTPEELGKELAVRYAKNYKEKEGSKQELCVSTIGGLLIVMGSIMKGASGSEPNPYAEYLITYHVLAAEHGCTEVHK